VSERRSSTARASRWQCAARTQRSARECRRGRGFTLVEVLIVVALIAVLASSVVLGPGLLRSSRMRSSATLIVSAVRTGMSRANTSGRPVRLVLDIDSNRLWLEESMTRGFSRAKDEAAAGADPQTEAEKKAKEETDRILEGPRAPRAQFKPVKDLIDPEDPTRGRDLGFGVQVAEVQTEHDEEPITEGRAYVFFWPGGVTERASIRLKRRDLTDDGLTVSISALNGRTSIVRGKVADSAPPEDPEGQGSSTEDNKP